MRNMKASVVTATSTVAMSSRTTGTAAAAGVRRAERQVRAAEAKAAGKLDLTGAAKRAAIRLVAALRPGGSVCRLSYLLYIRANILWLGCSAPQPYLQLLPRPSKLNPVPPPQLLPRLLRA